MDTYAVVAKARWDGKAFVALEVTGEERALREGMRVFREGTMYKIAIIDMKLKIIFTDTRRCRCTNVQMELGVEDDFVERCMDCGLVLNYDGWKRGVALEAPVEEEAQVG